MRNLYRRFLDLPLRTKFLASFVAVITLGGVLTLTIGTRIEHNTIFSLAQAKVRHDLSAAWMVYNERLNDIRDIVLLNSYRDSIQKAVQEKDRETLLANLERIRTKFRLDFLSVTDHTGKVICRTSYPDSWGDDKSGDFFIKNSLQGEVISGSTIMSHQELRKENPDLVEQALIKIKSTPKSELKKQDTVKNGLVLKSSAPVINEKGQITAVLYGGILLNKNYEIVDRVKEIVYKGEKYKGSDIGTVTIFLYEVRISTNVFNASGERAVGTKVSREVSQAVLQEGKSWIGRAYVVNDWYITAYEPIHNIKGDIIGMLYVGMLEKPYIDLRNKVMITFTSMAVLCVILLLVLLFLITSSIIHPLKNMVTATKNIARGDLNHKVIIPYKDEVGELAQSFNQMTANLKEANQKLIQWGKTLEKRVAERTKELKRAQDTLVQSAKMASLGKMAAGVAHEINNPLTSILINTHLMLEQIDENNSFYENLKLIADETTRCTSIVKGLLEFSRQNPPQKSYSEINEILTRTIQLLENQAAFQNIKIEKNLSSEIPPLLVDKNKLKQVFWNLMVNAAEAMPNGGSLTISTDISKDKKYIEIRFKDTGVGIPPEIIPKLYDPFFTTKSSGTGLGLAVSYGIIRQHSGTILVNSRPGEGSTFTIKLPLADKEKGKGGLYE